MNIIPVNRVLITLVLVALFLSMRGAAWAQSQPVAVRVASVAYSQGKETVFHGVSALIERDPILRADLQKLGARLQWVPVPHASVGATINEAFASGGIEFAHYGDLPSVILNAGGVETVIVGPGGDGSNVYVIVPANSPAKSIKDLKGKRISLHRGRPWEVSFARVLAANGLKFSDVRIKNLNPQAGASALAAGDVEAHVALFDTLPLVDKGIGRILWSSKTPGQNWKIRTELWGNKTFVQRNPAITQALVNSHVRAAHWVSRKENFEEFLRLTARSGQPEELVRKDYLDDSIPWKERWSPLYSDVLEHYRNVVSYSKSAGLIRKEFDAARLIDSQFIERALKEQKLQEHWRRKE
ncbi:MAG: ABC transporter substrate-binding protein [Zoogloeaceae bacterium]|nr:ABC transporter substrate-binding protein [Zoogloeaceae bacterium]